MTAQSPLHESAAKAFSTGFGAVLKLAPEGGAEIYVDGRTMPPEISDAPPVDGKPADCNWRAPMDIMLRAISSRRAAEHAFINGRLSISGDMSVMGRLKIDGGG